MEGHIGPACRTLRCDRYGIFGHATAGCRAPCQRRDHGYATTNCVQLKSYVAAAQQPGETRSRPPQQVVAPVALPAPEQSDDDSDLFIPLRSPPPPPAVSNSYASSNAGISDSKASGVVTATPPAKPRTFRLTRPPP
ncbi:hypothetical protein HPB47_009019, partial [Ixodes persulcatus]